MAAGLYEVVPELKTLVPVFKRYYRLIIRDVKIGCCVCVCARHSQRCKGR
jgi:hypothetical protein